MRFGTKKPGGNLGCDDFSVGLGFDGAKLLHELEELEEAGKVLRADLFQLSLLSRILEKLADMNAIRGIRALWDAEGMCVRQRRVGRLDGDWARQGL